MKPNAVHFGQFGVWGPVKSRLKFGPDRFIVGHKQTDKQTDTQAKFIKKKIGWFISKNRLVYIYLIQFNPKLWRH